MAEQWTCSEHGCFREAKVRGLCRRHYDKRYGAARRAGLPPDWAPPDALSPARKTAAAVRTERAAPRARQGRPCALTACGGTAAPLSDLCAPHDCYRTAQRALAARGLA